MIRGTAALAASGLFSSLLLGAPAAAAMFGPDYAPCGERTSTLEIVQCVSGKTRVWDDRLNAAFRALGNRIDPGQRTPLLAAQRLWLQYRDANCRFYAAQDGTIAQIQAAECLRAMTEDRARELEQAMKLD